jgi:hypothetical protein
MKKQYIYGEKKVCPICGKSFRSRDADSDNYQSKFCSGACRNKDRTIHKEVACVTCGSTFKPVRAAQKNCSRECGTTYRISHREFDPMVSIRNKLAVFCCSAIARCLRNKTDRTAKLLGYSVEDLRAHLEDNFEDGMSWNNYGKKNDQWSIDHTRPISRFTPTSTIKEINALSNLRPMWHTKNCSKKNKWGGQ